MTIDEIKTLSRFIVGGLLVCFRHNDKVRLLLDQCYIHQRKNSYFAKARELFTFDDFTEEEFRNPNQKFIECLGKNLCCIFTPLKKQKYSYYANFYHKNRYVKKPWPFFFDFDNIPDEEDDGFRPDFGVMISAAINSNHQLIYIVSKARKYGMENNRELWEENSILYHLNVRRRPAIWV